MKKLIALVLVMLMVFSIAPLVLAEEDATDDETVVEDDAEDETDEECGDCGKKYFRYSTGIS